MTWSGLLEVLERRHVYRIRPSLERMRQVMRALGDPQDSYPTVHIAGTNGKGSVAAALESVLRAQGYKTGLYTSPHLLDIRERSRINGALSPLSYLDSAALVLNAEIRMRARLTHFEFLTAAAFTLFKSERVHIAVVECGMGGRWDATNVLTRPLLSIITTVGLDHCEYLGSRISSIASEKAGIIKPGRPVVSGARGQAHAVIASTARRSQSRLYAIDRDFSASEPKAAARESCRRLRVVSGKKACIIPFALQGRYQIDNAAIAVKAIEAMARQGFPVSVKNRDKGLATIQWPGRFQFFKPAKKPYILLDGAHNPQAIEALLDSISSGTFRKLPKTFVYSAFKDKDYMAAGAAIARVADEVCLAPLQGPRAASLPELQRAFAQLKGPLRVMETPEAALSAAIADTPSQGLVIVTGSLSLVAEMLKTLREKTSREILHV